MSGKWTPGPWTTDFQFGERTIVKGGQRYPICNTHTAPWGETNCRRETANAQLIAAAPAMFAALEAVVAYLDTIEGLGEGGTSAYDVPSIMARAALSQALGEGQ
jgi:hypothetical protein